MSGLSILTRAGLTAALCLGLAGPALAEWRVLDEAELAAFLSDARISYGADGWQLIAATGRTVARMAEAPFGQTSVGEWQLQGAQYCQRWSRLAPGACYSVAHDGAGGVRFIDAMGNVSGGEITRE